MEKKQKKGKGNSVPMTEEERELYMMHKALAEEEATKKKQAMLTQFLKDKLRKEERNSATNQHKLTVKWRELSRKACGDELRHDIGVLSHTFERALGLKDSVIKGLRCDLEEKRRQAGHALCSHQQRMGQLLDHQKDRVLSLELQRSRVLEEMKQDFREERQLILSQYEKKCKDLEKVNFAIDQYYSEVDSSVRHHFQSTCLEIENRNTEDRSTLQSQLLADMEHLWNQVQSTICRYKESTEDQYVALDSLQAHNKLCVDKTDFHVKKLHKLQESITALRGRLSCTKRDCISELERLKEVKEEVTIQGQQLKVQICANRIRNRKHLSDLVKNCDGTSKKLKAIILKGDKLLRRAESCRRLEMKREKVYHCSSQSAEKQDLLDTLCTEPVSEEIDMSVQEISPMESCWHRYNVVLEENLWLQQEKARLREQNRQLHAQHRNVRAGISVCDEALRRGNPLLMVTKLPVHPSPAPATRRSISVVQLTL